MEPQTEVADEKRPQPCVFSESVLHTEYGMKGAGLWSEACLNICMHARNIQGMCRVPIEWWSTMNMAKVQPRKWNS